MKGIGRWCEKIQSGEGRDGSFKIVTLTETESATDLSTKVRS